jgi:hypothetical protein
MHEAQGAAFQAETAQCQLGDVMDVGFIVDEQDFPGVTWAMLKTKMT